MTKLELEILIMFRYNIQSYPSGPVPILVLYVSAPWILFINAMRAPMTRERYQTIAAKFSDFDYPIQCPLLKLFFHTKVCAHYSGHIYN